MDRQIYIQTQFTGYHRWDEAPECVAFLRNAHRHIFHVKVTVPVKHNNRAIEFFMMKQVVDNFISNVINNPPPDGNLGSCESMAERIAKYVHKYYKCEWNETVTVEVNEDNENGAVIRT